MQVHNDVREGSDRAVCYWQLGQSRRGLAGVGGRGGPAQETVQGGQAVGGAASGGAM